MNHPMYDLSERPMETAVPSEGKTKQKYYPSQTMSSEMIPELDNYDVGDEIDLHITGKVTEKREVKRGDKMICEYRIESHKGGVMASGKAKMKMEMGREQYGKMESKEKEGK